MKRVIFLLVFCISAVLLNAQVKNSNGQKVVRQIEAYLPNMSSPYITINFNYSDNLDLEEIHLNAPASFKIKWKKEDKKITRIQYDIDSGLRKDLVYHYTINDNNLISKCVIDNIGNDGCVLRYVYNYTYNVFNNITLSYKRAFFRERNEDFGELSDRYKEVFEWDLNYNVFTTEECGYQWKINQRFEHSVKFENRKYYAELINDTNIDLPLLYQYDGNCDRFEFVTEWNGNHSSNLIETNNTYYFDYTYDNEFGGTDLEEERGNIVQVDVYNSLKKLEKSYKIYYWE